MTDYSALERDHFGDPDKGTGIYAPKVVSDRCSHRKTWISMTDLPEVRAELQWCYDEGSGGPRTKAALKWAVEAIDRMIADAGETETEGEVRE